jgi:hypothetical protein
VWIACFASFLDASHPRNLLTKLKAPTSIGKIVNAPVSLSDLQLQKILNAIGALAQHGANWETVVPVFLSALLGICVGIGLEYFKDYRQRTKTESEENRKELVEINIATVALASQVEILVHFAFQVVIPHRRDSRSVLEMANMVSGGSQDTSQLLADINSNYPGMMMKSPDITFVEYDFIRKLSFAIEKEPDLLRHATWLIHLLRELRQRLQERNAQIDIAFSTAKNEPISLAAVIAAAQPLDSIACAEVIALQQAIEQVPKIANTLQRVGCPTRALVN